VDRHARLRRTINRNIIIVPPLPEDDDDWLMTSPEREGLRRPHSPDTAPMMRTRFRYDQTEPEADFWNEGMEGIDMDFDAELPTYEETFPNQEDYDGMDNFLNRYGNAAARAARPNTDMDWAPTYQDILNGIQTPNLRPVRPVEAPLPWSNAPMMSYPTPVDETKYIDVPKPQVVGVIDRTAQRAADYEKFKREMAATSARLKENSVNVDKMLNQHGGSYAKINNLRIQGENKYKPWYAHGNYMGPNWNDGKYQESKVAVQAVPVDYGDQQSMYHDNAYAAKSNLMWADLRYAKDMLFHGEDIENVTRNTIAGGVVGLQGLGRLVTGMY